MFSNHIIVSSKIKDPVQLKEMYTKRRRFKVDIISLLPLETLSSLTFCEYHRLYHSTALFYKLLNSLKIPVSALDDYDAFEVELVLLHLKTVAGLYVYFFAVVI